MYFSVFLFHNFITDPKICIPVDYDATSYMMSIIFFQGSSVAREPVARTSGTQVRMFMPGDVLPFASPDSFAGELQLSFGEFRHDITKSIYFLSIW